VFAVFGTKVHACPCVPADGWYAFGVMQPAPAASPRDRFAEITAASVRTTSDPADRLVEVEALIRTMNRECIAVDRNTLMERDLLRQRIAREAEDHVAPGPCSRAAIEPAPVMCEGCDVQVANIDLLDCTMRCTACRAKIGLPPIAAAAPADPLHAVIDGVPLRQLLKNDVGRRRENVWSAMRCAPTPAQRAAVSAHWSAELRAKVEAGQRADAERATSVVLDCAEDL
jgi:hypothetical protein